MVKSLAKTVETAQKTGISFKRYFTREGTHPFDEIEWETRDAVIKNEKGQVFFEQKGVEVPKAWSQTATNIVVSKYFRGKLGTEKREKSVRQLVTRVAKTMADWGRKDGYFADEQSAAIFEDELTHILVNQLAAFNSPVWFNVGVEAHPQCSACQPYHALLSTPNGLVQIGDIVTGNAAGTEVYDSNGVTRVMAVKHNGQKEVYRIQLANGSFVEATGDHLVRAVRERRTVPEWMRVDQLQLGMKMHLLPHVEKVDVEFPHAQASHVAVGSASQAQLQQVALATLEVAEAALAGWLQADGFVGQYATGTNNSLTVEFETVNDEEFAWVMGHLKTVLPDVHHKVTPVKTQSPDLTYKRIRLYGEKLRPFVEKYDLLKRGTEIRVPKLLFTSSRAAIQAYLKSVYQAEGFVATRGRTSRIGLATISRKWMEDVQNLLFSIGIYSRLSEKWERRIDRNNQHQIDIAIFSERNRFAERVGFISNEKREKLEASLRLPDGKNCPDLREETVVSIKPVGKQDVYDIQTESGEYLSNNIVVHNCFILSIKDDMEDILARVRDEGMIFKYGSGTGFNFSNLRSSKEMLSSGGIASGPVSFMKGFDAFAGIIKSGGKCFKQGTLVATPSGLRPIESLKVGELVLTHKGPRAVADFMPNGLKQCYRVRAREGYEVEVTEGHKFAYWDAAKGNFAVKPIEQFALGEAMYVLPSASEGGGKIPLAVPEANDPPHATTTAEMKFPAELNDELAYVLGLMYGDAELRTDYPYRVRVAFGKNEADQAAAARFKDYCQSLFGEVPILLGDETGHQQIGFTRKRLVEFLAANGLAKGKANELGFPRVLFRAFPEVRAAFVAGVIDSDGTYQRRGGWSISSIDRKFLVELQRLLLSLGVPSKIKLSRGKKGSWQALYKLRIVGHTFVDRLVHRIAPYSAKAIIDYEPSAGADKGWGYRPSLYRPLTARVEQRGGYRHVERTIGMNETTGYGALVQLVAHRDGAVADYAQELSQCVQVTLESVEPTEIAETYDIEVADAHLLSANGFYASNTRRAAKMVILNVDHPDVEEFVWCKAKEERKAKALISQGYDPSLTGDIYNNIFFQNANNSVRVTDDFMRAVESDGEWTTKFVQTGAPAQNMRARDLMKQIAEAAWECGDPGMQYDTTINNWHTSPNSGRINGSNPCFTADTRVTTDKGLIQFGELVARMNSGEHFKIYTHDKANQEKPGEGIDLTSPTQVMITGFNDIYRLKFSNGMEVKATPNHRFLTQRGMVRADELKPEDKVLVSDEPTPFVAAARKIPVSSDFEDYRKKGERYEPVNLPIEWTEEFAESLGHLIGDGSVSATDNVCTWVYGDEGDKAGLLPQHQQFFTGLFGHDMTVSEMSNGTLQLRTSRGAFKSFLGALGVKAAHGPDKEVPWAIFQAPHDIVAAFVRGLFNADGTIVELENGTRYAGLGSTSLKLLQGVQQLLLTFGIHSKIYNSKAEGSFGFAYRTKGGVDKNYYSHPCYDLRVSGRSLQRFAEQIGFSHPKKAEKLAAIVASREFYDVDTTVSLDSMEFVGKELTYNLTEPKNHSYVANGFVVANCSEYMFLDDTSCNLASLNLMKFLDSDGEFDVESFKKANEVVITAMEIIVGNSSYPTQLITQNSFDFRPLGIGFANLGSLLMYYGLPYDSDEGRNFAAAISALQSGWCYRQSAVISRDATGPFKGYAVNREPMLRVIGMHRDASYKIRPEGVPTDLLVESRRAWDEALELGRQDGFRNSQISVIAPTGTIGFLMDCDTTGIEPDIALVKYKFLVGGGVLKLVNSTVPHALKTLGYPDEQRKAILEYLDKSDTIEGAPGLRAEHLAVFDCAFKPARGSRSIHYMGHLKMMGAVQPFVSGAISKTVNVPTEITPDEIAQAYVTAWKLGVKALAIYRDGSKGQQVLATSIDSGTQKAKTEQKTAVEAKLAVTVASVATPVAKAPLQVSSRRHLPDTRAAVTHKFSINGHEGYLTVGLFEDGMPGELFITMAKEGSTLSGLLDAFATTVSISLQYGVPLKVFVKKFAHMRFEPSGVTNNKDIRFAKSIMDYIFRWMALQFLPAEDREELGITGAEVNGNGHTFPKVDVTPATPQQAVQASTPTVQTPTAAAKVPVREEVITLKRVTFENSVDAPACHLCGSIMVRNGNCYKCMNCGSTSGCS